MRNLYLLFVFIGTISISSCSGFVPIKNCIDCSQFPLVYQGTVVDYTKGIYLETACLTIDLSKFTGVDNFQIGDILFIEYSVKQGEFCSSDDESIYRLYTIKNDKDSEWPSELSGSGKGINLKIKEHESNNF